MRAEDAWRSREAPHDCLEIHYFGDSKLYLPVEKHRPSDAATARKAKACSWTGWASRLAGAARPGPRRRLREMRGPDRHRRRPAAETTAEIDPPAACSTNSAPAFPYEETRGPADSMGDVLADLASGKPMEPADLRRRGFGKTEVAPLGSPFVVAMSGKQWPWSAPRPAGRASDFKTFHQRALAAGRSRCGACRACGADAEANGTREALRRAEGRGHRRHPRGSPVRKRGLQGPGLVVVDEEQHLRGFKHNGRPLKALRAEVHMLTLSATPSPTLQMALGHPRDVDHRHPAVDRLSVRHLHHFAPRSGDHPRGPAARESTAAARPISSRRGSKDLANLERFLRRGAGARFVRRGHGPDGADPARRRDEGLL